MQIPNARSRLSSAFTLVELLVTIAIIAILATLLFPALTTAKHNARKVACQNNERQLVLALQLYAGDNGEFFPPPPGNGGVHTALLTPSAATNLLRYTRSYAVMDCPNLHARFTTPRTTPGVLVRDWRNNGYGPAIGYHYLGGRTNTPWPVFSYTIMAMPGELPFEKWISPIKSSDDAALLLVADLNTYYSGMSIAPHGRRGAIILEDDYFAAQQAVGLLSSRKAGAQGGNVGELNGAVYWKPIAQMRTRQCEFYSSMLGAW